MLQIIFSNRMLRAGAIASLLIIIGMSVVPGSNRPTVELGGLLIGGLGVIEHIIGYAICGSLFALGFLQWRTSLIFGALAALAGGLEIAQAFVPDRTPKLSDAVLSAAGAGLGICLALWLKPLWQATLENQTHGPLRRIKDRKADLQQIENGACQRGKREHEPRSQTAPVSQQIP